MKESDIITLVQIRFFFVHICDEIYYPLLKTSVLGAQKCLHIETVLLSNYNMVMPRLRN